MARSLASAGQPSQGTSLAQTRGDSAAEPDTATQPERCDRDGSSPGPPRPEDLASLLRHRAVLELDPMLLPDGLGADRGRSDRPRGPAAAARGGEGVLRARARRGAG